MARLRHGPPQPRRASRRVRPERLRGPPARGRRAARDGDLERRRRPPPRPDERREPQPVGVHDRRAGRPRRRGARAARRGRDPRDRHGAALGRAPPDRRRRRHPVRPARPTRRWTRRVELARAFGQRIAERFDLPVFLYAEAATPERAGQAGRRPARPVRGAESGDRPPRPRARLRAEPDAPVGRRRRGRRPAVPHRLQHQPRVAGPSSSRSGSPAGSANPGAGCRGSRRTASSSRSWAAPRSR